MKLVLQLKYKFFKKRIFFSNINTYHHDQNCAPIGYYCLKFKQNDLYKYVNIKEYVPKLLKLNQLEKDSLYTIACFKEINNDLVGIGFILIPKKNKVWYDNVPVHPGEARLIGDFVLPEHRGKGIGSCINSERITWIKRDLKAKIISVIVESHRISAIKAQQKFLNSTGTNYLLKIMGRNIFSIITGQLHTGIWYVGPGRQRKWYVENP